MMDETLDRISDLPPFLVHHIMSFIPAKEAARTSILSKRWKQFRSSFPILDFDQRNFRRLEDTYRYNLCFLRKNRKFRRSLKRFIKVVDRSLSRFCSLNLSIQKLRIFISILDLERSPPLFDKWIGLALEKGIKELDFQVISDEENNEVFTYTLPQTVFSANFLTNLCLAGCKLEQPSYTMSFHSLKKLSLERVCLNDQMVQKLVCECRLLEDLSFENCSGLKFLCISGAHKLKILQLGAESSELESVRIVVPSLERLILLFSPNWWGPRVLDIAACPHLKMLILMAFSLQDHEFHNFFSKFPLLEDLLLCGCPFLERIPISSYQLKHLNVVNCRSLKAIDADAPNLLSFSIQCNPFPIISLNSQCPWKKVELECHDDLGGRWFLGLKEFLGVPNQIEELTLDLRLTQSLFNLYELSRCSDSLPIQVGSLLVWMDLTDLSPSEYELVLDGFFWICYPRTLSLNTFYEEQHSFVSWVYDYMQNPDMKCCNSGHIKSWRHYLRETKIESFKSMEGHIFNEDEFNRLMDEWPKFPEGYLQFHLDWCFNE